MEVLQVHQRFKHWRNMIIFMICTLLVACSKAKPIDIYEPIDVSKSGQSVKIGFEISKKGDYQFALLFARGGSHNEMNRRDELFGNIYDDGVTTPVSLHLVRNDQVFFNEKINAGGCDGWQSFYYEERRVNTVVREIKLFSLPPGRYSAVITTLEDIPAFNGIESFVEFAYFSPKI
ncbi:hypothetical protein ID856_15080 [Xenorhabdus sp. 18]|uniref:DUF5625 family protein n=1 Tax=Xenorhabdus doucetiae TaxID=351671 RepID=UPI001997B8E3|nr:DUF5625 family protein [Xenorhabdus sp. 18]MBD2797849.1 hypothetical protein [Xenorhabdus sp. 18]